MTSGLLLLGKGETSLLLGGDDASPLLLLGGDLDLDLDLERESRESETELVFLLLLSSFLAPEDLARPRAAGGGDTDRDGERE